MIKFWKEKKNNPCWLIFSKFLFHTYDLRAKCTICLHRKILPFAIRKNAHRKYIVPCNDRGARFILLFWYFLEAAERKFHFFIQRKQMIQMTGKIARMSRRYGRKRGQPLYAIICLSLKAKNIPATICYDLRAQNFNVFGSSYCTFECFLPHTL